MMKDFIERFEQTARSMPDTIAIKFKSECLTYIEMYHCVNDLSKKILEVIGKEHNVPIVIYQNRGIEFIVSMLAVLKAGAYYIPIETPMPSDRFEYICTQVKPKIILTDEINTNELFQYPTKKVSLENRNCETESFLVERSESDLAYVMFTSGSTGKPKGVKITYANLCNLVWSFYDILYHKFDSTVNIGTISSFAFDASVKMIYPAFVYGHTLVIAEKSVKNFGRKIHYFHSNNEIVICDGTPSHLKLMMAQKTKIYSCAEYFIIGGENLEWKTLNEFCGYMKRRPTFINVYGPTECCVDIAYNIIDKEHRLCKEGAVPIGKPLPNNIIEIHDAQGQRITEQFVKGELWIRGNQVGYGYTDGELRGFIFEEEMSKRTYRTGDIAMYDNYNDIIIAGRLDRQVKVNGNRVELDEIASVIKEISDCTNVQVELIHEDERNYLVAFVELKNEKNITIQEWNELLSKRLPNYMIPQKYVFIEQFPLTNRGKTDREQLTELYYKEQNKR